MKDLILGIDTSNYKTSIALTDLEGNILVDKRIFLNVKQGERGLRQSHALFQHVQNLPILMKEAFSTQHGKICAVCASSRPRPIENSYMPCFTAGTSLGKSLASTLSVPYYETSHQEGHIEAIISKMSDLTDEFLVHHNSGGTCEILKVKYLKTGYDIEIIGGSKDISFGQLLDRVGVALNMVFPAGAEMDNIAVTTNSTSDFLKPITVKEPYINLSGIETQAQRIIEKILKNDEIDILMSNQLIKELFEKISKAIYEMGKLASKQHGLNNVILVGGVSSSRYIRNRINEFSTAALNNKNTIKNDISTAFVFGDADFSSDNAIGVALLGGKMYGNKTN